MLMKLFSVLSQWLFPEKCVLCGRLLEKNEMDLCHKCRIDAPECGLSRTKYPYLESWTAVWLYQDLVRRSILRYKFYGKRSYAAAYARLLGVKLMKEDRLQVDLITWVPISAKRLKKRGFDQCQLLAEALSREVNIPAVPLLKKLRDNPPQSGIVGHAHRKANVLGVYQVTDSAQLQEKRILLLDDILTTGATAGECARVLLTAGAREVHLGVVAASKQERTSR
jgi:ComF family protein